MTSVTSDDPPLLRGVWDFNAVLSLINMGASTERDDSSEGSAASSPPSLTYSESSEHGSDAVTSSSTSLGNFDKLWAFLGTAPPSSPLALPADGTESLGNHTAAKYIKTVTWRDEVQTDIEAETLHTKQNSKEPELAHLTKSQRKKERRRLRKLAGAQLQTSADELSESVPTTPTIPKRTRANKAHSNSEPETDTDTKLAIQRSRERRTIIQALISDAEMRKPPKAVTLNSAHELFDHRVSSSRQPKIPSEEPRYHLRSKDLPRTPNRAASEPASNLTDAFNKKNALRKLLYNRFESDWSTLAGLQYFHNSPYVASQELDPSGVHVFVDISNILIGFHDAIKIAMGKPRTFRLPRQRLSFYNLSLILQRGRPVAKRCLAGSDMLESIQEARQIGYETNILERVTKAKELTPRQRYWKTRDRAEKSGTSSGGEGLSAGSGTEDSPLRVPKRVEQAVDEILHLKMLESILDSEKPSTIVLATGDAAEAEYSQGFLAMCERALRFGWNVELVAFKQNMSYAYKRKEWIDRWDGRFRIIELDEFVETLRL